MSLFESRYVLQEQYKRDGFISPLDVISEEAALYLRKLYESLERSTGKSANSCGGNLHITDQFVHDVVTSPAILDVVEQLIGPDIMVWNSKVWVKEPESDNFVGWHQDVSWGLEPFDAITVWIALTDVTVASGPIEFIASTHHHSLPHVETYHKSNLLSRGQQIDWDAYNAAHPELPDMVPTKQHYKGVLQPGQCCVFNMRLAHASSPNTSKGRRMGLAIRYMPTTTRTTRPAGDTAMLVRGVDRYGHFLLERPPSETTPEEAAAMRRRSARLKGAAMMKGAIMGKVQSDSVYYGELVAAGGCRHTAVERMRWMCLATFLYVIHSSSA